MSTGQFGEQIGIRLNVRPGLNRLEVSLLEQAIHHSAHSTIDVPPVPRSLGSAADGDQIRSLPIVLLAVITDPQKGL